METPAPPAGAPVVPTPVVPAPAPAGAPSSPRLRQPAWLELRAGLDRRLAAGAAVAAVGADVAFRTGLTTVAVAIWIAVVAAALLASGRPRGTASRILIAAAPVMGLLLMLRASPWVVVPVTGAVVALLVIGVSLGADGAGPALSFPGLAGRAVIAVGHLGSAPGMLASHGGQPTTGTARRRAAAAGRGAMLGVPLMIVLGVLLALADPIFRSWFDLPAVFQHLVLILAGAYIFTGLSRAASVREPTLALPGTPRLGVTEASIVLGCMCAVYAVFVCAQLVALSGAGHRILVTQGLTYAQYARSGFFQLLACAAITLLVLLGVRACADGTHPLPRALSGLTVALTLGVVFVAFRRLELYEVAFGLTMLRLACMAVAVWIGVVFALLGVTLPQRGLARHWFPAAMACTGLLLVAVWGLSNPAAIVAHTNLHRAERGRPLDVSQAASLGPDAVPALTAGLPRLPAVAAADLRRAICARPVGHPTGTALNLSRLSASHAHTRACGNG